MNKIICSLLLAFCFSCNAFATTWVLHNAHLALPPGNEIYKDYKGTASGYLKYEHGTITEYEFTASDYDYCGPVGECQIWTSLPPAVLQPCISAAFFDPCYSSSPTSLSLYGYRTTIGFALSAPLDSEGPIFILSGSTGGYRLAISPSDFLPGAYFGGGSRNDFNALCSRGHVGLVWTQAAQSSTEVVPEFRTGG